MKTAFVALLVLAYLSTLAMSAGHLAQWYALSLGALPPWLAWGLAGSLEFTAFLLSLLSNSLLRGSSWASGGALAALLLVWMGNALSMHRAAPGLQPWETLAMSLFVPVGTWVVGKVVGEMVRVVPGDRERSGRAVPGGTALRAGGTAVVPRSPFPGTGVVQEVVPEGAGVAPSGVPGGTTFRESGTAPDQERTTIRYQEKTMELSVEGEGRAAEVLRVLSRYREPVSLTALVRDLGWPKTTVRRWLDRLEDQGLVHRTGEGWALREDRHA
ncbi:helix-turn-helix domain-containing protein [Thermus sp. PS18]|uniref:helix-turn-helix domain-containing protein n=1 Tax=Thermus sp. PS18 TaxID=2849039 RepID=UPI002264296D|nr:helix-turn-helix domain-containing protein [Thermus sp. PS18]UZX15013.1 helix-turn-helix domain-containing protein [Thermus sp. PS18]